VFFAFYIHTDRTTKTGEAHIELVVGCRFSQDSVDCRICLTAIAPFLTLKRFVTCDSIVSVTDKFRWYKREDIAVVYGVENEATLN